MRFTDLPFHRKAPVIQPFWGARRTGTRDALAVRRRNPLRYLRAFGRSSHVLQLELVMGRSNAKTETPVETLVCRNPKAFQRFEIEDKLEAGMALIGSEVKSLRGRRGDLEGAYASLDSNQLWLHKMHIAPYEQAGPFGHEPKRSRKLLVHGKQIERLRGRLTLRGYSLVPLRVYFKNGWAKVELGLGKGRSGKDRREEIKRDIARREARSAMSRGGK